MRHFFFILFLFSNFIIFSQRGKDGAGNITLANSTVNIYTPLTANAGGSSTISVGSTAGFAIGDLIFIIQMQGVSVNAGRDTLFPDVNSSIPTNTTYGGITNYNNCGNYEFAQIRVIPNNTTLVFDCSLSKNYSYLNKVQVIKVPRYTTLSVSGAGNITCPAWNGTVGGVIVVEVANNCTLTSTPSFNASALAFRGGSTPGMVLPLVTFGNKFGHISQSEGAYKGESVNGDTTRYQTYSAQHCRGAMANGGGGGTTHNSGGGGGANVGLLSAYNGRGNPQAGFNAAWNLESAGFAGSTSSGGGRGGYTWSNSNQNPGTTAPGAGAWGGDNRRVMGGIGGWPLDYSTGKLFVGGGGGAGHGNDNRSGAGGRGGGLVYILCYGNISGAGTILANGGNGSNSTTGCATNDGAGGAGGGGTVILDIIGTTNLTNATAISVRGGNGGNVSNNCGIPNSNSYGPGGGGGGGYIGVTGVLPLNSVAGGTNGLQTGNANSIQNNFPPNGSTAGGSGSTAVIAPSPTISVVHATTCINTSATVSASSGTSAISWYTVSAGGTPIGSGTTFVTPTFTSTGVFTLYAQPCPGTYRDPVFITVNNGPTVTVSSATACNGNSSTLTANGAATYSWSTGAVTNTISASPSVTTVYSVTGTTGLCSASVTGTITIINIPTITVNSPTTCAGSSVQITANGALNYTWSTGAFTSTIAVSPTVQTIYTVTGTNGNNCNNTNTATVSITPSPTLSLNSNSFNICGGSTATIIANGGTGTFSWSTGSTASVITTTTSGVYNVTITNVCGSSVQSATVTGGAAPIFTIIPSSTIICNSQSVTLNTSGSTGTFVWSNGAGNTPSISTNVPGIYTATLTNACGSSVYSINISDGSSSVNLAASSNTICSGGSVTLTASGTGTFAWSTGAGNVSSITVTNTGVYTVSLTNECPGAVTATFNILNGPLPTLSINASSPFYCEGQTATLTANGTSGTYSWNTGASGPIFTTSVSGIYTAAISNSCGVNSETINVLFQSAPIVSLTANKIMICSGETATLTANGINGGTLYAWNSSSNTANTETVNAAGNYIVTYTNVCGSSSAAISIYQSTLFPDFTFNPDGGVAPVLITFSNTSLNNSNNQWQFGNGNTSVLNSPNFNYTSPGTYTVTLIIENPDGCFASVTKTLVINDLGFGPIPQVFTPNGDGKNDLFEIKGLHQFPHNELVIYNRWGNLIHKKSPYENNWDGTSEKTSGKLPAGTYYFILKLGDANNTVYRGYVQVMY
ncbi:MAG: gliding motility-associated C-terminal domain-containing protein [Sphingobacteriaceae bacterium]|nr:gliding motility-associated C-terminal domain-containing protein [Sphingobacteriaceae bacterium]